MAGSENNEEATVRIGRRSGAHRLRILLVCAAAAERKAISGELQHSRWHEVLTLDEAVNMARAEFMVNERYHCVIYDPQMPDAKGLEGLRQLRGQSPQTAFVVLARYHKEAVIREALAAGARDYLIRGAYAGETVLSIIGHAMERQRLARRMPARIQQHYALSSRDPVTGMPGQYLMADLGAYAAGVAQRSGGRLALLYLDIGGLEAARNDLAGHANDAALREVTRILSDAVRGSDLVARIGHDEFVMLLGPLIAAREAEKVARRVVKQVHDIQTRGPRKLLLTAGIGVAEFPRDGDNYEQLLVNAGLAALAAKRRGPGHVEFYSPRLRGSAV